MISWGTFFGRIAEWFPGRRESKQNTIDKLLRENAKLQKEFPMSEGTAYRIESNAARIRQLRTEEGRIN